MGSIMKGPAARDAFARDRGIVLPIVFRGGIRPVERPRPFGGIAVRVVQAPCIGGVANVTDEVIVA